MLKQFKKLFDVRHDFNDSDLETLKERHPNITFVDIPAAWILPVDEMLCKMRYHNPVVSVIQSFGQLVVQFTDDPDKHQYIDRYQPHVVVAEQKVYKVDQDLYQLFGIYAGDME